MALIICSECGKQVSDTALTCPNCGNPIQKQVLEERKMNQKINCCTVFWKNEAKRHYAYASTALDAQSERRNTGTE